MIILVSSYQLAICMISGRRKVPFYGMKITLQSVMHLRAIKFIVNLVGTANMCDALGKPFMAPILANPNFASISLAV